MAGDGSGPEVQLSRARVLSRTAPSLGGNPEVSINTTPDERMANVSVRGQSRKGLLHAAETMAEADALAAKPTAAEKTAATKRTYEAARAQIKAENRDKALASREAMITQSAFGEPITTEQAAAAETEALDTVGEGTDFAASAIQDIRSGVEPVRPPENLTEWMAKLTPDNAVAAAPAMQTDAAETPMNAEDAVVADAVRGELEVLSTGGGGSSVAVVESGSGGGAAGGGAGDGDNGGGDGGRSRKKLADAVVSTGHSAGQATDSGDVQRTSPDGGDRRRLGSDRRSPAPTASSAVHPYVDRLNGKSSVANNGEVGASGADSSVVPEATPVVEQPAGGGVVSEVSDGSVAPFDMNLNELGRKFAGLNKTSPTYEADRERLQGDLRDAVETEAERRSPTELGTFLSPEQIITHLDTALAVNNEQASRVDPDSPLGQELRSQRIILSGEQADLRNKVYTPKFKQELDNEKGAYMSIVRTIPGSDAAVRLEEDRVIRGVEHIIEERLREQGISPDTTSTVLKEQLIAQENFLNNKRAMLQDLGATEPVGSPFGDVYGQLLSETETAQDLTHRNRFVIDLANRLSDADLLNITTEVARLKNSLKEDTPVMERLGIDHTVTTLQEVLAIRNENRMPGSRGSRGTWDVDRIVSNALKKQAELESTIPVIPAAEPRQGFMDRVNAIRARFARGGPQDPNRLDNAGIYGPSPVDLANLPQNTGEPIEPIDPDERRRRNRRLAATAAVLGVGAAGVGVATQIDWGRTAEMRPATVGQGQEVPINTDSAVGAPQYTGIGDGTGIDSTINQYGGVGNESYGPSVPTTTQAETVQTTVEQTAPASPQQEMKDLVNKHTKDLTITEGSSISQTMIDAGIVKDAQEYNEQFYTSPEGLLGSYILAYQDLLPSNPDLPPLADTIRAFNSASDKEAKDAVMQEMKTALDTVNAGTVVSVPDSLETATDIAKRASAAVNADTTGAAWDTFNQELANAFNADNGDVNAVVASVSNDVEDGSNADKELPIQPVDNGTGT